MVDLTDHPFGVALWSPYNAEFNEVLKSWSRNFGGRWQPRYRSWLFPAKAKPFLIAEISRCQSRHPEKIG
jgi:hypothetical protein